MNTEECLLTRLSGIIQNPLAFWNTFIAEKLQLLSVLARAIPVADLGSQGADDPMLCQLYDYDTDPDPIYHIRMTLLLYFVKPLV